MTGKQLRDLVFALIDEHCMEMGKEEYADCMEEIADDAKVRAEAAREELEDEE